MSATLLRIVTADDVRPAGPPETCFFCRRPIGQQHAFECVTVTVPRTYEVLLDAQTVGLWTCDDPVSWDRDQRYFHKNESSWCANNLLTSGALRLTEGRALPAPGDDCLCRRVELIPTESE